MAEHQGFNDAQGTRRAVEPRGVEPTGSEASEIASQGHMKMQPPAGQTASHNRASFSDPVSDDMDPTSPESPEQTLEYQHNQGLEAERLRQQGDTAPQQNIEDWRRRDVNTGDPDMKA